MEYVVMIFQFPPGMQIILQLLSNAPVMLARMMMLLVLPCCFDSSHSSPCFHLHSSINSSINYELFFYQNTKWVKVFPLFSGCYYSIIKSYMRLSVLWQHGQILSRHIFWNSFLKRSYWHAGIFSLCFPLMSELNYCLLSHGNLCFSLKSLQ